MKVTRLKSETQQLKHLEQGNCFRFHSNIWLKGTYESTNDRYICLDIVCGNVRYIGAQETVEPVDVECFVND